jgi:glycosyltransferase involved in cell wall biosynthesis
MATTRAHVLFLAYFFPPLESAGYSIRAVKFLKYLARGDWAFTVLAGDPERPITAPVASSGQFLLDEVPETVTVIRIPAPLHVGAAGARPRRLARLAGGLSAALADRWWMRRAERVAGQVARGRRVDVILATAPPFMVPVLAAGLKRRLGARLVLDFRDDWLDTPIFAAKPWWQQAVHRRFERQALAAADHVLAASEASCLDLQRRHAAQAGAIHYLPNGWDPDDLPPPLPPNARSAQFVIASAGGYQRADRSPEGLFRAVGQLITRRPEIGRSLRVQLIGSGLHRDFSAGELAGWGVADVVDEVPPLPRDGLMRRLQRAELLLAIPTAYWTRSIPGKLYEYGALGRAPVLLLDDPGSVPGRFVRAHGLGSAVERNDVAAIAAAVERYYDAWDAGAPVRIAAGALDAYSRRALAERLAAILRAASSW